MIGCLMKRVKEIIRIMPTGFALGLIAGLLVSQAQAQYKPTGDDGITASPRLRQQLDQRKARPSTKVAAAVMACSKCQDTWVSLPLGSVLGSGGRALTGNTTQLVAKHLCDGCRVDWAVTGTGKAKQSVATHNCSGCGSTDMACCSAKGSVSNVATKGMQKPVHVAPVK